MLLLFLLLFLSLLLVDAALLDYLFSSSSSSSQYERASPDDPHHYGVDVSTPIHSFHRFDPQSFQGQRYKKSMDNCAAKYSESECMSTERARVNMNADQPKSQHNYTEVGFKKMRVPEQIFEKILNFYETNKDKPHLENWPRGNTYTNHWDSPTYMVSVEDGRLRGAGQAFKSTIWGGVRPILEEWTGHTLKPSSLYGIRVYRDGAILATHADRLPLVTSCIINVAQDLREPWPIEVYDHAGRAHNVTMEPGDMVLYESHTVLHGRPTPLNGSYFANIFVHFIPVDHDAMNGKDKEQRKHEVRRTHGKVGGHEADNHDDSELELHRADHEAFLSKQLKKRKGDEGEHLPLNDAAASGKLAAVRGLVEKQPHLVNAADNNGWQPIHEGC